MEHPTRDIALIGCLTSAELFNGSTITRAIQPTHVPTLIETHCRPNRDDNTYCNAIRRFLLPRDHAEWIDETTMWGRL